MPTSEEALAEHGDDPAYIAMGNLLYGTDESEIPLTVRDPNGRVRDVTVTTGEQHIDAGAKALGISPKVLSFIDLLQVIFYPFLLWAAWLLHRRNSRDVVSSILSLAVLLTHRRRAALDRSSWPTIGIPRWLNVALFDLGNMLLLAGILLFPHGYLSWRRSALIACLPLLMFLHGTLYQAFFVGFMIIGGAGPAALPSADRIRASAAADPLGAVRLHRLRACCACISIASDYLKWSTGSFGQQLLVEMLARHQLRARRAVPPARAARSRCCAIRLYDAEIVIGRSANFAVITLGVAAVFAAAGDGAEADHLQLLRQHQQRGPDHLRGGAGDGAWSTRSRNGSSAGPRSGSRRTCSCFATTCREVVRDMRETASLRRNARRNPGADRSRRARGAQRR